MDITKFFSKKPAAPKPATAEAGSAASSSGTLPAKRKADDEEQPAGKAPTAGGEVPVASASAPAAKVKKEISPEDFFSFGAPSKPKAAAPAAAAPVAGGKPAVAAAAAATKASTTPVPVAAASMTTLKEVAGVFRVVGWVLTTPLLLCMTLGSLLAREPHIGPFIQARPRCSPRP